MNPFEIFRKDVTVIRYAQGSFINNIWVNGVETIFTIKASVQPSQAEVMEMLPEGYRDKGAYTLYTDTELNISVAGTTSPDIVLINGQRHIVKIVEPWGNDLINHYKVIVVNEDIDAA